MKRLLNARHIQVDINEIVFFQHLWLTVLLEEHEKQYCSSEPKEDVDGMRESVNPGLKDFDTFSDDSLNIHQLI